MLLGKTKISLVILTLLSSRQSSFLIISAATAFYEITLKIYGEMKKVHGGHSQSLQELFQNLGHTVGARYSQVMCWIDQADRKITENIPYNAYTDGRRTSKMYTFCVDDGYDCINVHSTYLE